MLSFAVAGLPQEYRNTGPPDWISRVTTKDQGQTLICKTVCVFLWHSRSTHDRGRYAKLLSRNTYTLT
ncbi:hypothetical protein A0H81_10138 [Grifola frondosa]|uniref:Uncharacterized protein n=1 Tax=Grifola frondosa TaxID=5627 RepID=A0A1C7LYH3_GRIFR|nr:hypothetical protein A0H81_10138 [Grifola frondosa]